MSGAPTPGAAIDPSANAVAPTPVAPGLTTDDAPTWPAEYAERYRTAGLWRGETFSQMLAARAAEHPDRVALVAGDSRLTYRELHERAERTAAGMHRLGVAPGDRVIIALPNVAAFLPTVFALFRLGALPVFALPTHRRTELVAFATQADAVALVIADRHAGFDHRTLADEVRSQAPTLRHVLVDGDPGAGHVALETVVGDPAELPGGPQAHALAFLQLSGGSTGTPKLIPRTHDDYLLSVRESARICGLDGASVYGCALPVAHNFPMSSPGVLGALWAGARVVLAPGPSPDESWALFARERVTITALVPPLALIWMAARPNRTDDLSALEVLQVGGAKLSEEAARRVGPVLGARLQQVFGMAEGLVNYTALDDPEDLVVSTQGRPISPWDELRVVDDEDRDVPAGGTGHLLTRGPYTIRGYFRAPEHNRRAFTEDGFYRTGDVVRITSEGCIVVEGRSKDQINRGGEKVAAEEVENHILAHPAVLDVAVVAMPDALLGERSCAFVVPRPDLEEALRPVEITRFVRTRGLAAFKVPDRVEVVESFPATGVGKVSKVALRAAIVARMSPAGA